MTFKNRVAGVLFLLAAGPTLQASTVVNFESTGEPLYEGMLIGDEYLATSGMGFRLADGRLPYLSEVGGEATAFWGPENSTQADLTLASEDVGKHFLTDDGQVAQSTTVSDLIVSFASPVASASGDILDVDGDEAWRIDALDALGDVIDSILLDALFAEAGDGKAASWSFSHGTNDISSILIAYVGVDHFQRGFAWDNFACDTLPAVGEVAQSAVIVPLPAAAWSGMATLAGLLAVKRGRRLLSALRA